MLFRHRLLALLALIYVAKTENLETFHGEELENLIKEDNHVIILFSSEECEGRCAALEKQLLTIREELAEALNAWVVRSPSNIWGVPEDSIVFVRESAPLLYVWEHETEDDMLDYLLANSKSKVLPLTDDNFEHDTQATTGATTGDWLLVFRRGECEPECGRALPHIEAVASLLQHQLSVALLNRDTTAPTTTRRFGVTSFPDVILIRQGKLYRYGGDVNSVAQLKAFATGEFEQVAAEEIPPVKSDISDAYQASVDWCRENPWTLLWSILGVSAFVGFVMLLQRPPPKRLLKKKKRE